jgi:hypothetical protein
MKAIVQDRFGSPDVLELREIDTPEAGDGEVLVRVQAASVNPADWYAMAGVPYVARAQTGLRRPRTRSATWGLDTPRGSWSSSSEAPLFAARPPAGSAMEAWAARPAPCDPRVVPISGR